MRISRGLATSLLASAVVVGGGIGRAHATEITIAGFGQPQGATNGFTLSPNVTDTATTLSMTNVAVDFTNFFGGIPGIGDMTLLANSISPAGSLFGQDGQQFSGSFCITSADNCGGVNFLSGQFTDAAFGTNGGTGLTVSVADPTETLSLTSDIVPANDLGTPNAFSLSLSTGSAPLAILGSGTTTTLGAAGGGNITYFTTGDVSATDAPVPEPASIGLFGAGLAFLGLTARRRRF